MSSSLRPHELQPARCLCPWDFPTQGSNPRLLHCRWILYCWVTGETHLGYYCLLKLTNQNISQYLSSIILRTWKTQRLNLVSIMINWSIITQYKLSLMAWDTCQDVMIQYVNYTGHKVFKFFRPFLLLLLHRKMDEGKKKYAPSVIKYLFYTYLHQRCNI